MPKRQNTRVCSNDSLKNDTRRMTRLADWYMSGKKSKTKVKNAVEIQD